MASLDKSKVSFVFYASRGIEISPYFCPKMPSMATQANFKLQKFFSKNFSFFKFYQKNDNKSDMKWDRDPTFPML